MSSQTRGLARSAVLPTLVGTFLAGTLSAHAQAPAAAPTAPSAPPPITINALIDGYYAYNFNKPTSSGGPGFNGPGDFRNFDGVDNAFSLGLAEVGLTRAVSSMSRLGFTIKVIYGPTATVVAGGTSASFDESTLNILQAYGTYLIPLKGKDLTVDAGKFVTHLGYEVIEPELNWNYSRSDLFAIFLPYYHSGVRASLPFGPTFTATGYIYNGWNNATTDNNVSKAYGFALAFTPSPKWSLTLNGLTSSEPDGYPIESVDDGSTDEETDGAPNRAKNVLEPILTYNFSPAFSAVVDANFDFGKGASPGDDTDGNGSWTASGVAGYLHYMMKSGSSLTLRGETFDDNKGFLTGNDGEKGTEFTLTYGIKSPLFVGAETRFEYRYDSLKDSAGDSLFASNTGSFTKKSQNTLSISENLSF